MLNNACGNVNVIFWSIIDKFRMMLQIMASLYNYHDDHNMFIVHAIEQTPKRQPFVPFLLLNL